jgi:hypothetical protein
VFVRGGLCVEPLVRWTALTDDASALDLALRFANCELGGHGAGEAAANSEAQDRFGPDGSFKGHLHSKTSTLIGLARLGRHLLTHGQPPEVSNPGRPRRLHERELRAGILAGRSA